MFAFHIIYKMSLLTKMFLKNSDFLQILENSGAGLLNACALYVGSQETPYVLRIFSKLTFVAMISHVEYRTFEASC